MLPWQLLGRAEIPGGGELRLMQRGKEFSIRLGSAQLMNSRSTGSEQALATLACDRICDRRQPRILIGGLGMGFTLRAALAVLGPQASVTVAELVPAVVAWARGPLAEMFAGTLDDPRVRIHVGDVRDVIATRPQTYDAILLDVDNGPEGLTMEANDRLYDLEGLAAARAALKPDGVLAVWSSTGSEPFTRRLRAAGFHAEAVTIGAGAGGGFRSIIWFATPGSVRPGRGAKVRSGRPKSGAPRRRQ